MQQIEAAYEGRVDMVQTVLKAVFGEPEKPAALAGPDAVKSVMRGLMARGKADG